MDERTLFAQIARELSGDGTREDVWRQALTDAGGDRTQAKVHYIRRRRDQLADLVAHRAPAQASRAVLDEFPSAMQRLRVELAQLLASTGKGSLYGPLGLTPECSDGEIGRTIAALRESGSAREAEKQYAIEALADPRRREIYDRRLYEQLRGHSLDKGAPPVASAAPPICDDDATQSRRYIRVAITVALVASAYVASQWAIKFQFDSADAAATEQSRASLEAWRAQNEAIQRAQQARWARQAEQTVQVRPSINDPDSTDLTDQDHDQAQGDDSRGAGGNPAIHEARYWACMNRALNGSDSARAQIACKRLR